MSDNVINKTHFVLIVDVSASMDKFKSQLNECLLAFREVYNKVDEKLRSLRCLFFNATIVSDTDEIPDEIPTCAKTTALYKTILEGLSTVDKKPRDYRLVIGILTDGENNHEPLNGRVAGDIIKAVEPEEVFYFCPEPKRESEALGLPLTYFKKFSEECFEQYSQCLSGSFSTECV